MLAFGAEQLGLGSSLKVHPSQIPNLPLQGFSNISTASDTKKFLCVCASSAPQSQTLTHPLLGLSISSTGIRIPEQSILVALELCLSMESRVLLSVVDKIGHWCAAMAIRHKLTRFAPFICASHPSPIMSADSALSQSLLLIAKYSKAAPEKCTSSNNPERGSFVLEGWNAEGYLTQFRRHLATADNAVPAADYQSSNPDGKPQTFLPPSPDFWTKLEQTVDTYPNLTDEGMQKLKDAIKVTKDALKKESVAPVILTDE